MKIIKSFAAALIALSVLTSCAAVQKVETFVQQVVTPDNFDTITIAYAGVSTVGRTYYNLCKRKTINKSCWQVIARLQPYENNAFKSYMDLDTFVKSNPSGDASTLIRLARGAINMLQSIQLQNGVK